MLFVFSVILFSACLFGSSSNLLEFSSDVWWSFGICSFFTLRDKETYWNLCVGRGGLSVPLPLSVMLPAPEGYAEPRSSHFFGILSVAHQVVAFLAHSLCAIDYWVSLLSVLQAHIELLPLIFWWAYTYFTVFPYRDILRERRWTWMAKPLFSPQKTLHNLHLCIQQSAQKVHFNELK